MDLNQDNKNTVCDIIVPLWNNVDVTKEFVRSLVEGTRSRVRVIFVDNDSADGTAEYLKSVKDTELCKFETISNEDNKGFLKAINQGLELSSAPYVCFSNNDLVFTEGWLSEIISIFDAYPDVGLLNPNSNNLNASLPKNKTFQEYRNELYEKNKGEMSECAFCIGFCMVIKREVVNKVGGFSEEYLPMFFEDTDYAMKVNAAGYRKGIALGSYVWHAEHASVKKIGNKGEEIFQNSKKIYEGKWGKTLRVAFIEKDKDDVIKDLDKAIELVRHGNFVWFYAEKFELNKDEIFAETGRQMVADIKVLKHCCRVNLFFKIIFKKKKYDLIVTKNKFLSRILAMFGYKVLEALDVSEISALKKG